MIIALKDVLMSDPMSSLAASDNGGQATAVTILDDAADLQICENRPESQQWAMLPDSPDGGFMDARDLATQSYVVDWLIPKMVVKGLPGVLGGAPKVGKTLVALDLVVSLALGAPFLGKFEAP